jgi:integrase
MLLPLKAIIKPKEIRRDGTCLIYFQYCYTSENRTQLNTEIGIPPKYWIKKKRVISEELPSEYGDVSNLNERLTQMQRSIEDLIALAVKQELTDKGMFVKQAFKPNIDVYALESDPIALQVLSSTKPKDATKLYEQFDDYITSKEKKVSKATLTVFKNVKEHLEAFEAYRKKRITFKSFDYDFYVNFIDFLTFDYVQPRRKEPIIGLKTNTIGKTIKQLRIFLKDRIRRKIVLPIDLTDYKIPEEETDAIYLSYEEIAKIYRTDLSEHPHLIEYRDLFVLACLTGLRFSDFSSLRPEDLRNNMLHKKQGKSDHWVIIPLKSEAKQIFTTQFQQKLPTLTNPEFNRYIKAIGKLAGITTLVTFSFKKGNKDVIETKPKYEWITSHTGRRSFCTNEFLAGTPVKLIMKISGHKKEKDFYRYIRITPEEAAIKMQQIWMERDNMVAFGVAQTG